MLTLGAIALLTRLRVALPFAAYDDDAFYYFQIARNLATGHGSTFDGIHLTNGYHPLWLLLCTLLMTLSRGRAFFVMLQGVAFLSFATSYFASRSLLRKVCPQEAPVFAGAAAVAIQCMLLIHGGMEITLTLPLALLLCTYRLGKDFRWDAARASIYGLLAALVVLSRLDSLLWILLLLGAELLLMRCEPADSRIMRLVAVFAGAVPLLLYGLLNHHWFHLWVPVSAAAKELRLHHGFSLAGLRNSLALLSQAYGIILVYPALVLLFCATIALIKRRGAGLTPDRAIAVTLMLFPVMQLAAQALTSDWAIWSWYLYPFALASAGALMILLADAPIANAQTSFGFYQPGLIVSSLVIPMGILYAVLSLGAPEIPHWVPIANGLQSFASTHPGVYAMGDCAGLSGYVLKSPIVQTEGLVMDKDFLDNIRQQRDLLTTLDRYGVRYYVTFNAIPVNGCYRFEEPLLAGPDSPRMRSTLCQHPVDSFQVGPMTLNIFDLAAPRTHAR